MNSMPFRQLKSFFKILIGVQYHIALLYTGQPSKASPPGGFPVKNKCFDTGFIRYYNIMRTEQRKAP